MSKMNRRIALNHAVHLALHGEVREESIVSKATELVGFLDDLPTLNVEAGSSLEFGAHYESQLVAVLNHPVAGLRKKNVRELLEVFEQVPDSVELNVGDVLQAGPRYLYDMGVSEKRRGKILEDLHAVADAHEVELSDVEAYASVSTSLWSNGHQDHLFNGDAAAAVAEDQAEPVRVTFTDGEEPAKPKCGCPNHTPFSIEELPGVTLDQLDITLSALMMLNERGIRTVQDLRNYGPTAVLSLNPRDQAVLGSFVAALLEAEPAQEEPAPTVQEVDGYLGLPLNSFSNLTPALIAELQSKGANTLRDLFENPLLIPSVMSHGIESWLALAGHLLTGLNKELEERNMNERDRASLKVKTAELQRLLAVAKNMATDEKVEASLPERIKARSGGRLLSDLLGSLVSGSNGQPVVIEGDSPEGQALLNLLRQRSGNPEATSGIVKIDSETDPAFSSLIDTLFGPGKKEPTKH